ncbi:MAG: hypothetical protein NUV97_03280, partial [archaeon]|nr:hypothetical protein [archaeon]
SCYEFGFFHAAVSLICITAEKFIMELSELKKGSHGKRLINLKKNEFIKQEPLKNLQDLCLTIPLYQLVFQEVSFLSTNLVFISRF